MVEECTRPSFEPCCPDKVEMAANFQVVSPGTSTIFINILEDTTECPFSSVDFTEPWSGEVCDNMGVSALPGAWAGQLQQQGQDFLERQISGCWRNYLPGTS